MLATIIVFHEEIHEFNNSDQPGSKAYLRPSGGIVEDSSVPITEVKLQRGYVDSKTGDSSFGEEIPISGNLSQAIADFINNHREKDSGIDCYGFVNLAAGVPKHIAPMWPKFWKTETVTPSAIQSGDTVFMNGNTHKESEVNIIVQGKTFRFKHAAICIADDLFISVYGSNGDVEFATYTDLQRSYQTDEVQVAVPL
jgi:cell wall-associated NlpC family hydrolase